MPTLVYYVSKEPGEDRQEIQTPNGLRYLRVVVCEDDNATGALDWANEHIRTGEIMLNTVDEFVIELP